MALEQWDRSQYIMHETGGTGLDILSDSVAQQFGGAERQKDISDGTVHTSDLFLLFIS